MINRYMFTGLERSESHNRADVSRESLTIVGFRGGSELLSRTGGGPNGYATRNAALKDAGTREMRRLPR